MIAKFDEILKIHEEILGEIETRETSKKIYDESEGD